jgi:hypothetical protein
MLMKPNAGIKPFTVATASAAPVGMQKMFTFRVHD